MIPHGTARGYNHHGCRCESCTRAVCLYNKRRLYEAGNGKPRMLPLTATQRRIRALRAIGYTLRALSAETGLHVDRLDIMSTAAPFGRQELTKRVNADTARVVADAFDRLFDKPGGSVRAVNDARKKGWAPPLAWDDASIGDPAAKPFMGVGERNFHRRFPMDPLLAACGVRFVAGPLASDSWASVAEMLRVPRSTALKWADRGMTSEQADRAACAAGFHPADIWPEWFDQAC
jgi:lambda repressor-like predicted transcriptional regulator